MEDGGDMLGNMEEAPARENGGILTLLIDLFVTKNIEAVMILSLGTLNLYLGGAILCSHGGV